MFEWKLEHLLAACLAELTLSHVFNCVSKGRGAALSASVTVAASKTNSECFTG